jgi:hypothetical protein
MITNHTKQGNNRARIPNIQVRNQLARITTKDEEGKGKARIQQQTGTHECGSQAATTNLPPTHWKNPSTLESMLLSPIRGGRRKPSDGIPQEEQAPRSQ